MDLSQLAPKPVLSHPVFPHTPGSHLAQVGSPSSPEGAIPSDGTLWPLLDMNVRHQLVLIDELVANHLQEETAVRPSQEKDSVLAHVLLLPGQWYHSG